MTVVASMFAARFNSFFKCIIKAVKTKTRPTDKTKAAKSNNQKSKLQNFKTHKSKLQNKATTKTQPTKKQTIIKRGEYYEILKSLRRSKGQHSQDVYR